MTQEKIGYKHYKRLGKLGLYETRYIIYWWSDDEPYDVDKIEKHYAIKKWKND